VPDVGSSAVARKEIPGEKDLKDSPGGSDWPPEQGIRAITLYVLEPEPSRQFLLARTGRTAEGDGATARDALAKALDYLPLALEQGCRLYRNFLPEDPAHHRRLASLQNVRVTLSGNTCFPTCRQRPLKRRL
jgi:hypothetical protein